MKVTVPSLPSSADIQQTLRQRSRPSGWALPKQKSSLAPEGVWSNADQDPVPPEKRTWTPLTFILYWFSDLVTFSTWSQGSSVVAAGLSATDAILICFVAAICNAVPTVLNGAIGSTLHIPFPIAIRASHGYWLSYFAIASRAVLALFWFGINTAAGGQAVTQMLIAIWPSYATIPNSLPASAGITTQGMCSYFLYHLVQFPFLFIPMHKLRPMFAVKAAVMPVIAIGMTVWIAKQAGTDSNFLAAPAKVQGSARVWLWLGSLTSVTGGFSTLAVNISDFSRFSKKPGNQLWQLPVIPIFKVSVGTCGVIAASASAKVYGTALWNPLLILEKWQTTPGGRAAAFFCAAGWCLAQICLNVSANSLSFANDFTSVWPKYINIHRASVFCFFVGGWAMCPWLILKSGQTFLNFISSYAIFMSVLAGLLFSDYYIIHKRRYHVPELYNPRGIYGAWNWRTAIVLATVIVPLLPGLAQKVNPAINIPDGLKNLFAINWLYGFFLSIVMYCALNYAFPNKRALITETVYGDPIEGREVEEKTIIDELSKAGSVSVTITPSKV